MRWAWHVTPFGETRNAYRILVRKPEGKRLLRRRRLRREDNIKMYCDSEVQQTTLILVSLQYFTLR
jgi:hypothetical protein